MVRKRQNYDQVVIEWRHFKTEEQKQNKNINCTQLKKKLTSFSSPLLASATTSSDMSFDKFSHFFVLGI